MNPQIFRNIRSTKQLIAFLEKENNSYSTFILEKLFRKDSLLNGLSIHDHHIIPSHMGGPDQPWNSILLTVEEHAEAHMLLYRNYACSQDLGASQMLNGQVTLGRQTIRRLATQTMIERNVSFYNRDVQRELGSRPKNRQPKARNIYVVSSLQKGFTLKHAQTGNVFTVQPNECSSLVYVMDKFMNHPLNTNKKESWETIQKKEKHSVLTALTRILTGHIDSKTKKCLFSVNGWMFLGVNL